jgi:hypothetical protein
MKKEFIISFIIICATYLVGSAYSALNNKAYRMTGDRLNDSYESVFVPNIIDIKSGVRPSVSHPVYKLNISQRSQSLQHNQQEVSIQNHYICR